MVIVYRDGRRINLSDDVLEHIATKHPDTILMLGTSIAGLQRLISDSIAEPTEVYTDDSGADYFLRSVGLYYLNVIVVNETVRTAYLISTRTHLKMKKKRWLRRLS